MKILTAAQMILRISSNLLIALQKLKIMVRFKLQIVLKS